MLTENTLNKLYEMRLTAMAKAFKDQLTDPNISKMSFEDRFGLLVDQEWTSRKNNHMKRLIKQAKFAESGACVEDIEYHADRNLDQTQIARLSTCNFITERHNVLLLGATGSGKTYIACALGMAAARSFLQVRYVRLPELLTELAIAHGNGTYPRAIQQYKKPALLILDEWLLYPSRKPKREIFSKSQSRDTRRRLQYSALSLTSPAGGIRSAILSLLTLSATASFTINTASSSTARNRCVSGKASKKTMRKEPSAHRALP